MALVHDSFSDFVLFPRDPSSYLDMLDGRGESGYDGLHSNGPTTSNMQQQFSDLAATTYDPYPTVLAYSSESSPYYSAPQFVLDAPKVDANQPARRWTPSGSPSPSVSQSYDHPPSAVSSVSGASGHSTASSVVGSPYSHPTQSLPGLESWADSHLGLGIAAGAFHSDRFGHDIFPSTNIDNDLIFEDGKYPSSFVDPSLIQPFDIPIAHNSSAAPYTGPIHAFQLPSQTFQPPSPASSDASSRDSHRPGSTRIRHSTTSPYLQTASYQPYPQGSEARRLSIASSFSRTSQDSPRSTSIGFDEDGRERGRCPNIDCGRLFKDLKAHMLTHQSERPEKCPIVTCEYHHKGFARKYDKNRHTLTHYKGTMVCGFCPGSGSAAEKSFNRADVFKRHLTSVHGVEQTPPNARKKSPAAVSAKKVLNGPTDIAGRCSTCSAMFNNAQEFYEHLDDCVLRVVQQEEPSEAINEQHLAGVANDLAVRQTLERHMLPVDPNYASQDVPILGEDEPGCEAKDEGSEMLTGSSKASTRSVHPRGVASHIGGGVSITKLNRTAVAAKGRGMTLSKGGVPLISKGRKKRKHYPTAWGCSTEKMKMKKRVLCVYDGSRRLLKDDMMLNSEFEVRLRLGSGTSYVTDLDVETVKRAEAFHDATEEEKGPWIQGDDVDIGQLMS